MPVGSIIELYTTMLGWYMYDALWGLLTGTGLVILPFIVAILQTLIKYSEREDQSTGDFVKALEVRIYIMIAVMLLAAQPMVTLQPTKMVFNDVYCEPAGTDINLIEKKTEETVFDDGGNTASNASNRFMGAINGSTIKIPLWWYVIVNLSNAITHSLKMELPCNPDFRLMSTGLANSQITDPDLRRELEQFQDDCWKKAVVTYLKDSKDPNFTVPNTISNVNQDVSWLGSRLFLTQAQYYPAERSSTSNEQYFWRETVDGPVATKEQTGDRWIPYCHEWWSENYSANGIDEGLRERTLTHIKAYDAGWTKWLEYWAANASGITSEASLDDYLLKLALQNNQTLTNGLSRNYEQRGSFLDTAGDTVSDVVSSIGIFFKSFPNRAEANTYRAAAPIIQALLIMLFAMFLPLLMSFMLFDLSKVMGISVILFSVIFWGYIFELAEYIDNYLLSSIISGFSDTELNENALAAANGIQGISGSSMSSDDKLAIEVLKWISRMSYVLLPVVFTGLVGMTGFRFAGAIEGAISGMGRGSASAAGSAASQIQGSVSSGVRRFKR